MSTSKPADAPPPSGVEETPAERVNWNDFRDHLSTADQEGRRQWLFPRQPAGRFYQARKWLSYALLMVMFVGPFVRINGNPLLLMDIVNRRFIIAGQVFWPQDGIILAIGLLVFLTGIAVFTAAYGRLWCGWVCPQTVLMELVFRRIEYWIEGDAHAQRALDRASWTVSKWAKRLFKHGVFLALSFVVGNTLLSYIVGTEQLFAIITDNPLNHLQGLSFMVVFTLIFYGIFARFREQACTFICPYGRFQSTLLDENSIVVAYDHRRGEKRGTLRRRQSREHRQAEGLGDCVDCKQCVTVCPTGIDIRDGTQMECVHCTACMDACDQVMARISRPSGLIRYASLNGIERGERIKVTPRLVGYSVLLLALIVLEAFLVFNRSDVDATLLRAPGSLYRQTASGRYSNVYMLKLINKTTRDVPVELRLENKQGAVVPTEKHLVVPAQKLTETSVLIELGVDQLEGPTTALAIGVYDRDGRRLQQVKTAFVGPRDAGRVQQR